MTRRIFWSSLLAAAAALALSIVLVAGVMYGHLVRTERAALSAAADQIGAGVARGGLDYLASLPASDTRVTWIAADGTVLFDSAADASALENHAGREEVREALLSQAGESARYSATLAGTTFYHALRLPDGTVLRTARTQRSVLLLLLDMAPALLAVLAATAALAGVLSARAARRIVEPVNALDLDHPEAGAAYPELTPLLRRLRAQQREIAAQVAAVQHGEETLRAITAHMNEGFVALDAEGRVVTVNGSAARLLHADETDACGRKLIALHRGEALLRAAAEALAGRPARATLEADGRTVAIYADPVFRCGAPAAAGAGGASSANPAGPANPANAVAGTASGSAAAAANGAAGTVSGSAAAAANGAAEAASGGPVAGANGAAAGTANAGSAGNSVNPAAGPPAPANPATAAGPRQLTGAVLFFVDETERVQAEQLRREFSANVSHELKTPLTSISGYAELIAAGLAAPADVPGFAARIRAEAARLLALIEDVMELSRLDEGAPAAVREDVELRALAAEIAARFDAAAAARDVQITVAGCDAHVHGVRRVLDDMLSNLIDNAVKYNVPGGSVAVSVQDAPDGARLTVADTGIGIPAEHRDKVFERFYRVDKSHSRQTGGTGLGLSIVKHGAALHGAELRLDSEPGRGTAVTLRFPPRP